MITQSRKQFDNNELEHSQTTRHMIPYLLFFILICFIDIGLLVLHLDQTNYLATKLVIDSIVTILALAFHQKMSNKQMNIFLAIIKFTTLVIICLIKQDVIILIFFISEINGYPEQNIEFIIQRIITKIGGLIIIIISSSSILEIIILLCILLMETCNIYFYFQSQKIHQNEHLLSNLQSRTQRESQSLNQKENFWMNKIQQMPIGIILFSIHDLKIMLSNQVCYHYFDTFCENQAALEEFVLDKLQFQVIQRQKDEDNVKQTYKKNMNRYDYSLSVKDSENQIISISISDSKFSLRQIVNYLQEGQFTQNLNQSTNSLGLQCQLVQDQGIQSFYSCQLTINQEEGEIQLILLDITSYQQVQIEDIQDQFKSQIVQSFSHELRTPLNSACNFLQCCLSDKNIQKETRQKLIKPAYNSLRLQSHLINDIIDFSCFFVKDIELEIKEFSIKDLIDEVNQLFKSSIEMKKLALYVDLYENSMHTLTTDFARLMQIIVNVLQNSIKYSNSGIIVLKLSNLSSDQIKFTVKDQGIGINEDRLIQIQQMLQDIERRPGPPKHKKWHGFGLLVSQMLLSRLCPKNFKSLLIRSGGRDEGTKVSFYIKNHLPGASTPSSSGFNGIQTLRQISKIKLSFQSIPKQSSIIGTMIQIADMVVSPNWKKNGTFKSHEFAYNLESQLINEVDQKMNDLNHVRPTLITEIGGKSKQLTNEFHMIESPVYQSARELQAQNVLSYSKLKLKDGHDSDSIMKEIFKRRKCNCKRILSVDDEIFNQKSIQFLLTQQGFDVTLAFNGEEAINTINLIERCSANCHLYMIILMDYQMPIMDGIQTTRALRQMMQQQVIPQIHIIGLTAFHGKKDIQHCIEAGMSDVLAKPLKMKELFDILNLL